MNTVCLEKLWTVTDSLWMLNNNPDAATFGSVRDFDPVAANIGFWCEIDGNCLKRVV